jgi:hypothetical protein
LRAVLELHQPYGLEGSYDGFAIDLGDEGGFGWEVPIEQSLGNAASLGQRAGLSREAVLGEELARARKY